MLERAVDKGERRLFGVLAGVVFFESTTSDRFLNGDRIRVMKSPPFCAKYEAG